ncbi:hypothetical protein [Pedobacter hiemivivus]|nr:hypothetical protein [Pedobacter hiemivivus]
MFIQKASTLPINQVLQVPLLRLSEMYLILTECAETKTAVETAKRHMPFIAIRKEFPLLLLMRKTG